MDRNARTILFGLIAVLILPIAALAAAVLIAFEVPQPAGIDDLSGEVELELAGGEPATLTPDELEESQPLDIGESIRLAPGSSATVTFFNGGRAKLSGPSSLKLVDSNRRATALGHATSSGKFNREYTLTIEQSEGTVHYRFDDTDPAFEQIKITVRLPDRSYKPTTPCWVVEVGIETISAAPEDCY